VSTAAFKVVTISPATMANIVRPAAAHTDTGPIEKHTNTPTPGIATSLSPTTIGLICGLGGCGILGFFIWAIVYFRWFKPIEIRIKEGEAGYYNTPTAEQNKNKNRNSTITDVKQSIFAHNAIGISTERPATDGGVYPRDVNNQANQAELAIFSRSLAYIG
jgi:hypothetical protein